MSSPTEPTDSVWDEDEKTAMIGKLGYVPPEARGDSDTDNFDPDRLSSGDREKFRKRKRAKKTPVWMKLATGGLAIVVVAALGGGIWWLATGAGDNGDEDGPTFEAVDKPCDLLDTDPMSDVIGSDSVDVQDNETEERAHSHRQACTALFGEPGQGGSIDVNTHVYKSPAGAQNELEFDARDAKADAEEHPETQKFEKVSGAGANAFAVIRQPSADSDTIDYSIHYSVDNVYIATRVGVFNGQASMDQAAEYAKSIGDQYLENWKSA